MSLEIIKRLGLFFVLCAVQVLVLNHIHLFDVAIPLLYIYFVITFHRNFPIWALLLWSFTLGLAIDVFSNTPGLAAGTMTLIAVIQPYLLELFIPKDSIEELKVSVTTLGWVKFTMFSAILIGIYCLVFFALEAFSLFNLVRWIECFVCSSLLSLVLILAIESVRSK